MNPDELKRRESMAKACESIRHGCFPHLREARTPEQARSMKLAAASEGLRAKLFRSK